MLLSFFKYFYSSLDALHMHYRAYQNTSHNLFFMIDVQQAFMLPIAPLLHNSFLLTCISNILIA